MPYAVTHVILTIVIADIYRDYFAKRKFPMVYVLIAGIAGLMPDLDIPASGLINLLFGANYNFHRIFTHSLLYAMVFFAASTLFFIFGKKEYSVFRRKVQNRAVVLFFLAMAFGWLMHVSLDCGLSGDGYLNLIPSIPLKFCPHPFSSDVLAGFDAAILVLWLIHEQWKHDIKDYI